MQRMRTTVRLPRDLLREAKTRAAERGTTLTRLIEEALRAALGREEGPIQKGAPPTLPTAGGSGLLPGVNLDDTAALLERMESSDDPA